LVYLFFIVILAGASYYLYKLGYDSVTIESSESITDTTDASVTTSDIEPLVEQVEATPIPPLEENIQIEILNGCGVNGIAKIFQSYLRTQGFDVVNTDNYLVEGKRYWGLQESKIIDYMGNMEQAEALARSLGISLSKIEVNESEIAIYDMSVVIGKDYKQLKGLQ
jgi:hypothetical protein